ncbi:RAI1-domain-containing protein [Mytilinidion resinicola]|uniref:Decapping nuclease n=1 Tax=Mytilinidion resinicola TaxID=574789 RepID=A0A6A6YQT9_9PEZI|nr:RAI1-domain-containing protein [Mytilinidion resinicola]KAF2811150.1 RAI1-domain-containing protein [Mytilinidion resinicola]
MAATFDVQPVNRFAGKCPPLKRPQEIAYFSYDDDHKFRLDESSLKYFYPPEYSHHLPANLCDGFDTFQKHDDSIDEHLDSLLTTIMEMEKAEGKRSEVDFITWRGMVTKILTAPFDHFSKFEMNATLFQGTIFIEDCHEAKVADQGRQRSQPSRPGAHSQDMMSYWGYKFETLCVMPNTWGETSREFIENRHKHIVSNKAQYCSVVKTGFANSSLIIGGEVDAVQTKKPYDPEIPGSKDRPIPWVELKTSEVIQSDRDVLKFERKLLKFWAQSFLLGVPRVTVGFRTKEGILTHLQNLEVLKIPGQVKNGKGTWDGNSCINFTGAFLDFLKKTITSEGIWKIRRLEKSPVIEVFQVEPSGHGRILTPEFINWRQQQIAGEVMRML